MLAHVDGLLDQEVELLRERRGESVGFEDADDLVAGDGAHLSDAVAISEDLADLGWADALLRVVADDLNAVLTAELEPVRRGAAVRDGGAGNAFAGGVETTHSNEAKPGKPEKNSFDEVNR